MLKKNYSTDFAIIQAFNHKGFVEKNLKLNYLNARKAGICDIDEMIETLKECKQDYGIYTFDWLVITGNTQKFKDVPLLYDNQAVYTSFVNYANSTDNFDNFGEFGGWTRPTAKIYSYTRNCGIFVANVFKPTLNEFKKCYN
uniref:Peptidase_C25 domain-containing protein n=1 Tax=Meloidogyne hapla TaxID=6305 RepID=A0A1I8B442_MELHA